MRFDPTALTPYLAGNTDTSGDCWLWTGYCRPDGYGISSGTEQKAHRLVWTTLVGAIPEGFHLHHLCENKGCVNPEHLLPLSPSDHRKLHPTPLTAKHGSRRRYMNGCRCDECKRKNREYARELRARLLTRRVPDHIHGTDNGYRNYGCRCAACKEAGRVTNLAYRRGCMQD